MKVFLGFLCAAVCCFLEVRGQVNGSLPLPTVISVEDALVQLGTAVPPPQGLQGPPGGPDPDDSSSCPPGERCPPPPPPLISFTQLQSIAGGSNPPQQIQTSTCAYKQNPVGKFRLNNLPYVCQVVKGICSSTVYRAVCSCSRCRRPNGIFGQCVPVFTDDVWAYINCVNLNTNQKLSYWSRLRVPSYCSCS